MVYRIRYIKAGRNEQCIERMEANSPAEAQLKFLAIREPSSPPRDVITSVCPEENLQSLQW